MPYPLGYMFPLPYYHDTMHALSWHCITVTHYQHHQTHLQPQTHILWPQHYGYFSFTARKMTPWKGDKTRESTMYNACNVCRPYNYPYKWHCIWQSLYLCAFQRGIKCSAQNITYSFKGTVSMQYFNTHLRIMTVIIIKHISNYIDTLREYCDVSCICYMSYVYWGFIYSATCPFACHGLCNMGNLGLIIMFFGSVFSASVT